MKNNRGSQGPLRQLAGVVLFLQFIFVLVSLGTIIFSDAARFDVKAILAVLSALVLGAMFKTFKLL